MNDVEALAEEHLALARENAHGRSAVLVAQNGPLRQTLLALRAGAQLGAHNAPLAATAYVLQGSITVDWDNGSVAISENQMENIPDARHSVLATEDSVFLLTAVTETRDVQSV